MLYIYIFCLCSTPYCTHISIHRRRRLAGIVGHSTRGIDEAKVATDLFVFSNFGAAARRHVSHPRRQHSRCYRVTCIGLHAEKHLGALRTVWCAARTPHCFGSPAVERHKVTAPQRQPLLHIGVEGGKERRSGVRVFRAGVGEGRLHAQLTSTPRMSVLVGGSWEIGADGEREKKREEENCSRSAKENVSSAFHI